MKLSTIKIWYIKKLVKLLVLMFGDVFFSIDYRRGFNLNFRLPEDYYKKLLPDGLHPLRIKLLEEDSHEEFQLSIYLSELGGLGNQTSVRADIFTYCLDTRGRLSLLFLGAFEDSHLKLKGFQRYFSNAFRDFARRNTKTREMSYQVFLTTENIVWNEKIVKVICPEINLHIESINIIKNKCLFDRKWVAANSRIYRNSNDRNENFFNDLFSEADVKKVDLSSIKIKTANTFYGGFIKKENLVSCQVYGGNEPIRWWFEERSSQNRS